MQYRWLGLLLTTSLMACVDPIQFSDLNNGLQNQNGSLDGTNDEVSSTVSQAWTSGDATLIDDVSELVDATDVLLTQQESARDTLVQQSTESASALTWDPTHDSSILMPTLGDNFPLLISNDSANGADQTNYLTLAVAGETDSSRYAVFGGNPMRNAASNAALVNEDMHDFMQNTIEWLTGQSLASLEKITLAQLDQSYYFPDYNSVANWLTERGATATKNAYQACDDAALAGCLVDTDLLIISQIALDSAQAANIAQTVQSAMNAGVPVLYLHHNGNLTNLGAELFQNWHVHFVKDNYWSKERITNLSPAELQQLTRDQSEDMSAFLSALANDTWSFDLTSCDDNCANQSAFADEFSSIASGIRTRLRGYDRDGVRLFDQVGFNLDKSLVLLADIYRSEWSFPMDKATTPRKEFMRALFADAAQYQRRDVAMVPADLGNFSRTSFPDVERVSHSVNVSSRKPFRAAGVYAMPGQTVTVTRTDNSDVVTSVFVNTIRDGATHLWDTDGFKRPRYLSGQSMSLAPGETISFTSSYGGPMQVNFDRNDETVVLQFQNVALHPYWNDSSDDDTFAQALTDDRFDWAEMSTPAFEVHSKIEKMRDSASNANWPTAAQLAAATSKYTYNYPHVLAGFQGSGIDVVSEIHDFAADKGWTISSLEQVKHMNADQATCGYGCSGNPYDAYWSFNPTGHGDIHELGHGLERARFRLLNSGGSTWETHATTNPYSYYSKSRLFAETGFDPDCQSLPFGTLYTQLQTAAASADAFAAMESFDFAWNTGVAFYIQLMMAAQNQGALTDGWNLWARLHIYEREFQRVRGSDTLWADSVDALGLTGMTRTEAQAMNNNDWMAIALSVSAGMDFRPYLALYGRPVSDAASAQLDFLGLPSFSAEFYDVNGSDYCKGLARDTLPLDGTTAWPYSQ